MTEADQDTDTAGPERLASAVTARRKWLGLSQEEVAAAGGPSAKTIYAIEQRTATTLRPSTLARLDSALQWRVGTTAKILAGTATVAELNEVVQRPGLAERVGSAYVPPLGSAIRALGGRPDLKDGAHLRVAATLDALIAEDHERLNALLDEGRQPGEPEVEEVLARLVLRAEQRSRLG